MLSEIQLIEHRFLALELESLAWQSDSLVEENYKIQAAMTEPKLDQETDVWTVSLDVRIEPQSAEANCRYRGQFRILGQFKLHPEFAVEKRQDMVKMNGGSLLMGAIREMALLLSLRSAHGPLQLPTFDARMFLSAGTPVGAST